VGAVMDVTAATRAEAELRRSEAYLAEAQRLSHTGSWAQNLLPGDAGYWSAEAYRIFGLDPDHPPSLSPQEMLARVHPEDAPRVEALVQQAIREKTDFEADCRTLLPDGSTRYIHAVGHPVVNPSGEVVELVGTVMDVTEHKRAERAVRRARERMLEARFAAVLDERTRLARDIHDTLLQGFTGVALKLLAGINQVTGPPTTIAALRDVVGLAQRTLADARRAVWDLRAPTLAGGDFPAAVRAAAEDGVRGSGLTLEYEVEGSPRPVDSDVEAVVARVAQEAIANIVKHAAARSVRIGLAFEPRGLRLSVADDGRGFAVDPDFRTYSGHWGLLGMRERASQIRGRLSVRSAPGQGTEIVLLVPYTIRRRSRRRSEPLSPAP
jgi:PAS domain S-box-containing protein